MTGLSLVLSLHLFKLIESYKAIPIDIHHIECIRNSICWILLHFLQCLPSLSSELTWVWLMQYTFIIHHSIGNRLSYYLAKFENPPMTEFYCRAGDSRPIDCSSWKKKMEKNVLQSSSNLAGGYFVTSVFQPRKNFPFWRNWVGVLAKRISQIFPIQVLADRPCLSLAYAIYPIYT